MKNSHVNKTIGIITFHRAINYGAILQVYALQEKLKELGADCTVLDYRNENLEKVHKERKLSKSKTIKDYIRYFVLYRNYNKRHKKFRRFSNVNLNLSKPYNNINELEKASTDFDSFISGSDQVWNFSITDFDPAYFLGFVDDISKKNSYAASFGIKSIPQKHKEEYFSLLKEYNYMSIREKQGAKIIKELYDKDVEVVLDPTLLISKDEWEIIASDNLISEKYILIYAFGGSNYLMDLAMKLSKNTGYKIVVISNNFKKKLNIQYIKTAGPEEFLGLFKYAEYIFTNSFHGTAFSINFNKKFFTEFLPESKGVNSRLEDILELFNLQHRQVIKDDISIFNNSIDYEKVNKKLDQEREKSIKFLKKVIDG